MARVVAARVGGRVRASRDDSAADPARGLAAAPPCAWEGPRTTTTTCTAAHAPQGAASQRRARPVFFFFDADGERRHLRRQPC